MVTKDQDHIRKEWLQLPDMNTSLWWLKKQYRQVPRSAPLAVMIPFHASSHSIQNTLHTWIKVPMVEPGRIHSFASEASWSAGKVPAVETDLKGLRDLHFIRASLLNLQTSHDKKWNLILYLEKKLAHLNFLFHNFNETHEYYWQGWNERSHLQGFCGTNQQNI